MCRALMTTPNIQMTAGCSHTSCFVRVQQITPIDLALQDLPPTAMIRSILFAVFALSYAANAIERRRKALSRAARPLVHAHRSWLFRVPRLQSLAGLLRPSSSRRLPSVQCPLPRPRLLRSPSRRVSRRWRWPRRSPSRRRCLAT